MHIIDRLERCIARKAIRELLAAGFELGVCDGEEHVLSNSTDAEAVFAAMFSTDEDYLVVYRKGDWMCAGSFGWVRFVYGNSGWDVISDYTTNLEFALVGTNKLAEKYDALLS